MVKINELEWNLNSVPVLIDDFKSSDKIHMTRCNYFSIETDSPSFGWTLELSNTQIPFIMMGLSGIITRSLKGGPFTDLNSIKSLFVAIEENPALYVDINEIWLPNILFKRNANRGDVYRISEKLFISSLNFQKRQIQLKHFQEIALEFRTNMIYSELESISFRNWEKEIINQAREIYPKNKELELKWFE